MGPTACFPEMENRKKGKGKGFLGALAVKGKRWVSGGKCPRPPRRPWTYRKSGASSGDQGPLCPCSQNQASLDSQTRRRICPARPRSDPTFRETAVAPCADETPVTVFGARVSSVTGPWYGRRLSLYLRLLTSSGSVRLTDR